MTKYQPVRLWVGHIFGGREGQVDILFDRQSASQPAYQLQLASQPDMWQNINLSGFGLVRYLVAGGPGAQILVPLGSYIPDQGQASDTNELCSLLYTTGTMFRDCLQFCIYAPQSHILACTVQKCYKDYVLSTPIYTYPSTINLMHYYSKVLLLQNYFYHQKSEMLWEKVWKRYIWAQVNKT